MRKPNTSPEDLLAISTEYYNVLLTLYALDGMLKAAIRVLEELAPAPHEEPVPHEQEELQRPS